jgi:two-component system, OmpR family, response regulator MprA
MASKKILIVDDDPGILNMLGLMFQFEGYQSITCNHAQEALARIQSDKPDVVLLDAMMPHLNGLDLLNILRETKMHNLPPVILLTGSSDPAYRKTALQAGACDILSKPFIKEELLARIKSLLEKAS